MLVWPFATAGCLVLLSILWLLVRDWSGDAIANLESESERVRSLRKIRHTAYWSFAASVLASGYFLGAFEILFQPWYRMTFESIVDGLMSFLLLCYLPLVGGLAFIYATSVPYVNEAKCRNYPRHNAVFDFLKLCLVHSILPVGLGSILLLFPPGLPTGAGTALFYVLFTVFSPFVVTVANDVRPPTEAERAIFEAVEGPDDVQLLVAHASDAKQALGVATGIVPGNRLVLLTDYLLERLDPQQARAVVAHEYSHFDRLNQYRAGLVSVTIGFWFGAWSALRGSFLVWGAGGSLIFLLVTRAVRRRLEYRADEAAANQIGEDAMADALDRLASVNVFPREFGPVNRWFQTHPSIDDRIERLRTRES